MTREQYKRAKRRCILEPIICVAFVVLMMAVCGFIANKVAPLAP